MTTTTNGAGMDMVLVDAHNGITVIPSSTPLTQLNYFDGKYLRAGDLQVEQDYLHSLVQLSNRAGGAGVVHGYDTVLSKTGDAGIISPGLAIDGDGRVLLLPVEQTLDLAKLIAALQTPATASGAAGPGDFVACATASAGSGTATVPTPGLYLLTVGHLTGLCGDEDVYGQICQDACVTSKNRRYRLEGVIFRARPITLDLSGYAAKNIVPITAKFLRSAYASAYYADEAARVSSLISGAGLRADTWCLGAAAACGAEVPLALFLRSSSGTQFLDAWSARRERIDPPARRYWAWRTRMRPWDVYLAQILQFQCQLHELLGPVTSGPSTDPCANEHAIIGDASSVIARIEDYYAKLASALSTVPGWVELAANAPSLAELQALKAQLDGATATPPAAPDAGYGTLIDGGIVELPPAGYLPIDTASGESVNAQVRRYVGPGLDLRYCIVRPDFVAHALEQRQHMDRIPLLDGIADPAAMPAVDILVPNGKLAQTKATIDGHEFVIQLQAQPDKPDDRGTTVPLRGAARFRPLSSGYAGAAALFSDPQNSASGGDANQRQQAYFLAASFDRDPFASAGPGETQVDFWLTSAKPADAMEGLKPAGKEPGEPAVASGAAPTLTQLIEVAELRASIKYSVTQGPVPGPTPGTTIVTGNAAVLYGRTTQTLPGPVTKNNGGTTLAVLTLTRTDLGGGDFAIEARIASDAANYITFTWHQQSHQATLSTATEPLASGAEQANVLETDNPASLRVQQALDFIVNTGLVPANWRPDAAAKLWPPAPSATGGVAVLPGLDWVLFCRRRDCLCNIDAPPAPARAFQVWAIDLAGKPWSDETRKAILANPAQYAPTKIDVIDFPAGSYALNNAAKAPQRWTAVIKDLGYVIQWAGIAMSGVPDASWLESNRLDAYEAAIASVAPSVPGTALRDVLSYVPPGLSVSGTDGILLLVIAEQTVPVYRLLPSQAGLDFLDQPSKYSLQEGVSASYLDSVVLTRASGSTDLTLTAKWDAHHDGPPYGYLVVSKPNAQGIDQSRLATRAKDLIAELGGTLMTQGTITDPGTTWPPRGSDAVIVLLPWVQVVAYQESSPPSPPTSLASRISKATKLGVGRFQPDRSTLDNAQDFLHKWEGQTNGIAYLDVDVYASSGQGDDSKIDSMQSDALLPRINAITNALGIGEVQQIPAPIFLSDDAFTEAPFIIFIRVVFVPR